MEREILLPPLFGVAIEPAAAAPAATAPSPLTRHVPRDFQALHQPALVESWWNRLLTVVRDPVQVVAHGSERWVRTIGICRLHFAQDGCAEGALWLPRDDRMEWVDVAADLLVLSQMPFGEGWLTRIAEACAFEAGQSLAARGQSHSRAELEAYTDWVLAHFGVALRRLGLVRPMRDKIAAALNLDQEVLRLCRRAIFRLPVLGPMPANEVRLSDYNRVLRHKARVLKLEREFPALLPLYIGLLGDESISADPEPARAVRLHLERQGIASRTWRLLAKGNQRFLLPVREFYRGDPGAAMLDYLRIVQALRPARQLDALVIRQILLRYAHQGHRVTSFLPGLLPVFQLYGHAVRNFMALEDRAAEQRWLAPVLESLVTGGCALLDKQQRKAGWPWLVARTKEWLAFRENQLESAGVAWTVPVESMSIGAIHFTPLRSRHDLWVEGSAMRHCAVTYAQACEAGGDLVVALRRTDAEGTRLATALYRWEAEAWVLKQLRGFANRLPGTDLEPAARQFQELLNAPPEQQDLQLPLWEPDCLYMSHPGPGHPSNTPRTARLVAQMHWRRPDGTTHAQRYMLGSNRGRTVWTLWQHYGDGKRGGWGEGNYVAHMGRKGLGAVEAARRMLACALDEECEWWREDRFDAIHATGILSAEDIDKVADEIWTLELVRWRSRSKQTQSTGENE